MPAAIPLALIGSAVGGVASAAIGSSAAKSAANAQVDAANNAANLQHQDAQAALDFNKLQYGNSLNLMAPYYNTGTASLNRLGFLMGLSPQTGLPGGVVNPNAPATSSPIFAGGGGTFNRFNFMPTLPGGSNPMASDPNLGTLPPNVRGGTPQPLQDGTAGGGGGGFSASSGFVPRNGMASVPFQNPDAHSFDAGNGAVQASTGGAVTADGSPGMVPRLDGGGDPSNPTAPVPGGGFGSLATNFGEKWQAPTGVTEINDPGYQFRINQGLQALQNSAAARGKLLSGDTAKGLSDYAQNSASSEFGNVYNRALNDYTTRYNAFNQDQNTLFNRFATLSGLGQTSAGQLSNAGLSTAGNNSNILLTSGAQIGQDLQNAGAARGSGYVGSANAINGGISGLSNLAAILAMLNKGGSTAGAGGQGV